MDAQLPHANDSLSASLTAAAALLAADPESAATTAGEALDLRPGQPQSLLLLVSALRLIGAEEGACTLLEGMAEEHPNLASVQYEAGLLLSRFGRHDEAVERLSRTVALEPSHPAAWRALGHELARKGDRAAASSAYAQHARLSLRELKLVEDASADDTEKSQAEYVLRQSLDINPTDVFARRTLGEHLLRRGRLREAEIELRNAVDLAPGCESTRYMYCMALTQMMDWEGANRQLQILLQSNPGSPHLESLLAGNLGMRGERDAALRILEKLLPQPTNDRIVWLNYALAARTLGLDTQIVIDAYRKCLAIDPSYGTAWWGLADLKTFRFTAEEIATMREQLQRTDISEGLLCHLEFALGSALENSGEYAESFEHYRRGNEYRRPHINYNADSVHEDMQKTKAYFTPAFFEKRRGIGCEAPDPIFIVGMARSGSTLVEQILASHSQVEGTMELPDLNDMVARLMRENPDLPFPDLLDTLDRRAFRALGEEYLERTRSQRKLGRPFFTDKAGNNFLYAGLIQAILPNAKIVDARRHPLACGFSCYKQAFAPGALLLSYDQVDIGRYYRDYVETMAHFDMVLPGRIHRIIHEDLLRDPEGEIARLLEYCGLPFEESCLRFHETERSVRTSSSHQVRQPIQKKKVEAWQHYEPWLQPMKDALGDVLTLYPAVPAFS